MFSLKFLWGNGSGFVHSDEKVIDRSSGDVTGLLPVKRDNCTISCYRTRLSIDYLPGNRFRRVGDSFLIDCPVQEVRPVETGSSQSRFWHTDTSPTSGPESTTDLFKTPAQSLGNSHSACTFDR